MASILKRLSGSGKKSEDEPTTKGPGLAESKPTAPAGINEESTTTTTSGADPFASQRDTLASPFSATEQNGGTTSTSSTGDGTDTNQVSFSEPAPDRRASSDEWDASKTPPSRFQQRKGSVYATPASRDGHVEKNVNRDAAFHELHDKKHGKGKRRGSTAAS